MKNHEQIYPAIPPPFLGLALSHHLYPRISYWAPVSEPGFFGFVTKTGFFIILNGIEEV